MGPRHRIARFGTGVLFLALEWVWAVPVSMGQGDNAALLSFLDRAERRYDEVQDYTAVLLRRERIGELLRPQETILLKFQRPFKVYMRWLEGPGRGREGLYVRGAHGDKFLVHEPRGIRRLFTAALSPSDQRVLAESRHPITDVGIGRLLEIVAENARRAARNGVLRLVDLGPGEVAGRRVQQVEGILPRKPEAGYYCYRVFLAFDQEHSLPIRVVVYDWDDQLVEEYIYTELHLNPGLTARDFDPDNSDYGFSGRIRIRG